MTKNFFISGILFSLVSTCWSIEPSEFKVGGFLFNRPAEWKWIVPSSTMRKAQLAVPATEGSPAEITFFHFGSGQGGGVKANVDRWFAQFGNSNASQSEEKVGEKRIVYAVAQGTFQSGMPGGPTTPLENYALEGAILEDPQNGDVFVKMTGPAALVASATPTFREMIRAAAASQP